MPKKRKPFSDVLIESYEERRDKFLDIYHNAVEHDYILEQLGFFESYIENYTTEKFLSRIQSDQIKFHKETIFGFKRYVEFLKQRKVEISTNQSKKSHNKHSKPIPNLLDIIIDVRGFFSYLDKIIDKDPGMLSYDRNTGEYHWKGTISYLAAFALVLRGKNKFKISEKGNKDFDSFNGSELARVFGKFFNVAIGDTSNGRSAKYFRGENIKKEHTSFFHFITDHDG